MKNKLTFIDLFSGIGGFRIALENLGCQCVFSSEIDNHARKVYFDNFHEYPSGDITKINAWDIPDHDILCAGFPCQPFSLAGKRLGFDDTRGTLFFDVARILREKKPKIFFLENVSGIINHDSGQTLKTIEKTLRKLEYDFKYLVMNAYDYGVPQNRNRWYCVGFRKDLNIKLNGKSPDFDFPSKRPLQYTLEDILQDITGKEYLITERARENINRHLSSFMQSGRYCDENILIANEVRYSRCHFRCDGISPCLTAKMGTGGNNIPIVVKEMRKLTEKECLKLMGFPSDFKIQSNKMQSYKQIGNSVVVTIIEEIARRFLSTLNT